MDVISYTMIILYPVVLVIFAGLVMKHYIDLAEHYFKELTQLNTRYNRLAEEYRSYKNNVENIKSPLLNSEHTK